MCRSISPYRLEQNHLGQSCLNRAHRGGEVHRALISEYVGARQDETAFAAITASAASILALYWMAFGTYCIE